MHGAKQPVQAGQALGRRLAAQAVAEDGSAHEARQVARIRSISTVNHVYQRGKDGSHVWRYTIASGAIPLGNRVAKGDDRASGNYSRTRVSGTGRGKKRTRGAARRKHVLPRDAVAGIPNEGAERHNQGRACDDFPSHAGTIARGCLFPARINRP